jgi:hypothetical protein
MLTSNAVSPSLVLPANDVPLPVAKVHLVRFGRHHCEIQTSAPGSVTSAARTYECRAFVSLADRVWRPIVRHDGEAIVVRDRVEGRALAGMLRVLEHHLGPVRELARSLPHRDHADVSGQPWLLPAGRGKCGRSHLEGVVCELVSAGTPVLV